jgi:NADPH:quinone reductase-like Zn-dependent oxidoreductase
MKAIIYTEYGGMERLLMQEVAKPTPRDNEVLIRNHAASINDWDLALLHGDLINRLINGLFKPKRKILGSDIAGRIEAVGKNVTAFKPGDDVYTDLSGQWGGFAEYSCAPEKGLALKPAAMSYVDAASIPQAAMLAVQGLTDEGKIAAGQKLLVNGAGGGVGTFAVQIAKLYGVETTGVDRSDKLDMLRSIGFDHVIDHTQEDFTKNGQRYDLILDVKTNRPISAYARSLNRHGTYVTVGGSTARLLQALLMAPFIRMFQKKGIRIVSLKPNKDLPYMNELFVSGKLKPVIEGPFQLDEFAEAFRIYGKAAHKGKVVMTM